MFSSFGYTEMMLFGIIALMLFGGRLPEVARNFGRNYREFRKKIDEFQREFKELERMDPPKISSREVVSGADVERTKPVAPKFTPPPADDDSAS